MSVRTEMSEDREWRRIQ